MKTLSMRFGTLKTHFSDLFNEMKIPLKTIFKTVAKHLECVLRHWQHISTNLMTIENHFKSNRRLDQFLMYYCCFALLFWVADSMENKNQKLQYIRTKPSL